MSSPLNEFSRMKWQSAVVNAFDGEIEKTLGQYTMDANSLRVVYMEDSQVLLVFRGIPADTEGNG